VLQRAGETEGELWRLDEEVVLRGRTEPTRLAMLARAPAATAAS
jgi:hypothetical protein